MNATKVYEPVAEHPHPTGNGVQKVFRFDNGYGASVVQFSIGVIGGREAGSYGIEAGLWELAVITFPGEENDAFDLTYATPVTDDVIGYLSGDEVQEKLAEIEALPPTGEEKAEEAGA